MLDVAGGDAVQPVQGAAVVPCTRDGALQPGAPLLLLVPGGAGLEGGRQRGLGPGWHACAQLLQPQIRLPRGTLKLPPTEQGTCTDSHSTGQAYFH